MSAPPEDTFELSTQPAHAWLARVEFQIKALAEQRLVVRRALHSEQQALHDLHPRGKEKFSEQDARTLARNEVLGPQWQQANERVHHARARVLSARRQLEALAISLRTTQERSRGWSYWLIHAPRHAWKARPLKGRLQEANARRREALRTLQPLRARLIIPEVRSKIILLTEAIMVKEERLTHSVESRREIEQKVSGALSPALALAPRLRELGDQMITMKQPKHAPLQLVTLPVLVEPLYRPKPVLQAGHGMRLK